MKQILTILFTLLVLPTLAQTERTQGKRFYDQTTSVLRSKVLAAADQALKEQPITVTAQTSARSAGGRHDFFSEGDYWWPNPVSADSPYIQKDGRSNPDNFVAHRLAMIRFSRIVGTLASAWCITHKEQYLKRQWSIAGRGL